MTLKFYSLYESLIDFFLTEGVVDYSKMANLNRKVMSINKNIKDKVQRKNELKKLSKELILHVTNQNYKNILDNFLPDLKQISGKLNDEEFKNKLTESLTSLKPNEYNDFWATLDKNILDISNTHSELRYLRPSYVMTTF